MESNTQELQAVAAADPQPVVAVVGEVRELRAIEGADRIQLAIVDCAAHGTWSGVVGKDVESEALVLVLLQDALLPENERWAFMSKHKWRVRMARFKGVPSECVILPLTLEEAEIWSLGQDVGGQLDIMKYSKPLPAEMVGKAKGNFPSFIPKTDEPNFQRVRDRDELMQCDWYATLKYDGTSGTAFVKDGDLRVCSRNWELDREAGGVYWQMAEKYVMARLPDGTALQFEIIGPGIQGNPIGLTEPEIRVFTVWDIGLQRRLSAVGRDTFCAVLDLPVAETVAVGRGPRDNDALQKLAEVTYPTGNPGEGLVFRGMDNEFSFKTINLLYKN